jgi:general L-amino acid transport system permease protein
MEHSVAYVRTEDAPILKPPANLVGVRGWVMANLFPNWSNSILTVVAALFAYWVLSNVLGWAIFRATWTGESRDACIVEGAGACWPFVQAKFAQWIYGFYPIDQRWRVNVCFFVGAAALIPLLMPSLPYKKWNALFLLFAFPLLALILLTGGHFSFGFGAFISFVVQFLAIVAAFLPLTVFGIENGIKSAKPGLILVGLGLVLRVLSYAFDIPLPAIIDSVSTTYLIALLLMLAGGAWGLLQVLGAGPQASRPVLRAWLSGGVALLLVAILLKWDFGLEYVETSQWGGLLVTLVVAITGIVFSLPVGILLALGRRSNMPIVKYFSIGFIEIWRGVPLITVLFMASYMLPLFLPPGTNFDKLTRVLIGIALFSSAYMAEVVRGGLQAIPKGQIEAAQALGLPYWSTMNLIVLPQALRIVIPGIVNSFISLFKDTTLVTVVGLYDLMGIVIAGFADAKWASSQTAPTGYFTAALLFWVFCFGMSRYSQYVERRLNTGHKR